MKTLTFLSRLSKLECKPVILHSCSEHCETFIPKFKPPERARLSNKMKPGLVLTQKNVNASGFIFQV